MAECAERRARAVAVEREASEARVSFVHEVIPERPGYKAFSPGVSDRKGLKWNHS